MIICHYYTRDSLGRPACRFYRVAGPTRCGGNINRCAVPGGPPDEVCGCRPGRSLCSHGRALRQQVEGEFDVIRTDPLGGLDWGEFGGATENYRAHLGHPPKKKPGGRRP